MKIFGFWTLLIALLISGVAAYYSIIGLTAIFAAAFIPIVIMGSALEVAKVTTAVWLHRYWHVAPFLMKFYLTIATVVLMFITSMGIFGFLSKAHVEQTSAATESVAQIERIDSELLRLDQIIKRAEGRIAKAENSTGNRNDDIQEQIEAEQNRISQAYQRVQPAIDEQNQIIESARANDANRTKPYEDQLSNIKDELVRLENSAKEYESTITRLEVDNSAVEPLLAQIAAIEEEIIRVTNQINSGEKAAVRAAQAIIGVSSDGLFGNNTREALAKWVSGQRDRITQIQGEVAQVRRDAQGEVNSERERLAGVVNDIRQVQIPRVKERELTMLTKIEEVRAEESPIVKTAREEIARIRRSVDEQIVASNKLIAELREKIQIDNGADIDAIIDEQQLKIKETNNSIDKLTEEKYSLEAENRKLEAEVGPVKYIAEMVYGEQANKSLLEEAVRWVILLLVAVFDPLAIVLVLAGVMTIHKFGRPDPPDTNVKKPLPEVEPIEEEHQEPEQENKIDEETKQTEAPKEDAKVAQEDVATVGVKEKQESIKDPQQDNSSNTRTQQAKPAVKAPKSIAEKASEVKTIKNVTLKKRVKKDDPDNSWLSS
jgi:hypothetical protein